MKLKADRHRWILERIDELGSVRAAELAAESGHSVATIRRDLTELAEARLLERAYGGATRRAAAVQPGGSPLAGQASATIGLILPSSEYYYSPVIKGAMGSIRAAGMRGILAVTGYSSDEELRQFERLRSLGVDGLVVTPARDLTSNDEFADKLANVAFPVVLTERAAGGLHALARLDVVYNDHELGARLAVRHLYEQGRRSIALAPIPTTTLTRLERGYATEMRELGLEVPQLDLDASEDERAVWSHTPQHPLTEELLLSVLRCGSDAIVINSDLHASHFLNIALSRGVRIPADLAVVAYDDEIADVLEPPLTAIAPAKLELGALAAELCIERVRNGRGDAYGRHVALVPQLRVRESSLAAVGGAAASPGAMTEGGPVTDTAMSRGMHRAH